MIAPSHESMGGVVTGLLQSSIYAVDSMWVESDKK